MTKAERRAIEAYPVNIREMEAGMGGLTLPYDANKFSREKFQEGYEQAEKDLALTWEDVKEIVRIADTMMDFDPNDRPEWMESDKAYYTEVLKRFKEGEQ